MLCGYWLYSQVGSEINRADFWMSRVELSLGKGKFKNNRQINSLFLSENGNDPKIFWHLLDFVDKLYFSYTWIDNESRWPVPPEWIE